MDQSDLARPLATIYLPMLTPRPVCPRPQTYLMQPDRTAKEAELAKLKAEKEALERELKAFADSDPAAYKAVKERIGGAKQAADRWTDNVFAVRASLAFTSAASPAVAWGVSSSSFGRSRQSTGFIAPATYFHAPPRPCRS